MPQTIAAVSSITAVEGMSVHRMIQEALEEFAGREMPDFIRQVNYAQRRLYHVRPWKHFESEYTFTTDPVYNTGTATFTNGSTTVAGSGTTWLSTHTGWRIRKSGDVQSYGVTYVGATSLTLDTEYQGTTEADATYVLFHNEYAAPSDMESPVVLVDEEDGVPLLEQSAEAFFRTMGKLGDATVSRATAYCWFKENASGYRLMRFRDAPVEERALTLYYRRTFTQVADPYDRPDFPVWCDRAVFLDICRVYASRFATEDEKLYGRRRDIEQFYMEELRAAKRHDDNLTRPLYMNYWGGLNV